ncbi:MAG: hypothetical protein Q9208_002108 [Pyrenodesmia sp. 3 TL-2023]
MSLLQTSLKRISTVIPTNLIHFGSFPGRLVQRANPPEDCWNNEVIVKKGKVDAGNDPKHVYQGASLWKPDYTLAKVIAWYLKSESEWHYPEEDPAMIWEVPKGTRIPPGLKLLERNIGTYSPFVLQPKEPMSFDALQTALREMQISTTSRQFSPIDASVKEGDGRVIRLHDWMTADNPLIVRYPEITRGLPPEKRGDSGGWDYSWEAVRLVRKPVCVGYRSKVVMSRLQGNLKTEDER